MKPTISSVIAVCGTDFGWGSAGTIADVLDALEKQMHESPEVVMLGSALGRPLLNGYPVAAWYEQWPRDPVALRALLQDHGVSAGLVVLDPEAADALENAGCPTVYVDSLPFLWSGQDPLPVSVTSYCAQLCFVLPHLCWPALRRIERLVWIESIVAEPGVSYASGEGYAVVNLGGLHSPTIGEARDVYSQLVLGPTLSALSDAGYRRIEVCGNLDQAAAPNDFEISAAVSMGRHSHRNFLHLLDGADLLVTSPGLITLMEAGVRGLPTLCLPPQNVSQVLIGDQFAALVDAHCRILWPSEILSRADLERVRATSEEEGLRLIYNTLSNAVGNTGLPGYLRSELTHGLQWLRELAVPTWKSMTEVCGTRGAVQVASILSKIIVSS